MHCQEHQFVKRYMMLAESDGKQNKKELGFRRFNVLKGREHESDDRAARRLVQ